MDLYTHLKFVIFMPLIEKNTKLGDVCEDASSKLLSVSAKAFFPRVQTCTTIVCLSHLSVCPCVHTDGFGLGTIDRRL